jgi:hypothetical protein
MVHRASTRNQSQSLDPVGDPIWSVANRVALFSLFGIIALIAVTLRIQYVVGHDLWNDEILSSLTVSTDLPTMINMLQSDVHPPLYYAFLKAAFWTLGGVGSIDGLRLLDAVSWLSVAGFALLFYSWRIDRDSALPSLIGFAFIGLAPAQAYFGAEFRMYGMLMSLGIVCAVGAATLIRSEGAKKWWVGSIVGLTFGALATTHYAGTLLAICIFATMVTLNWIRNRKISYAIWVIVGVLVVVLPSLPVVVHSAFNNIPYKRTLAQSWHFVMFGGGIIVAILLVALLVRKAVSRSSFRVPELGLVATLASVLFLLILAAFSIFEGGNLSTFGVTTMWITLMALAGAHALSSVRLVSTWVLITAVLVIGFGSVTASAIHRPWEFEPNRVSTVDDFRKILDIDPSLGVDLGAGVSVLHVDWKRSNNYFKQKIQEQLPRLTIKVLNTRELPEASHVFEELCDTDKSVFVVMRGSRKRLEPLVPDGTGLKPVGLRVTQICLPDE